MDNYFLVCQPCYDVVNPVTNINVCFKWHFSTRFKSINCCTTKAWSWHKNQSSSHLLKILFLNHMESSDSLFLRQLCYCYQEIFNNIYEYPNSWNHVHIQHQRVVKTAAYMLWIYPFHMNHIYKLGLAITSLGHMIRIGSKCWLLDSEVILNHFSWCLPLIAVIWFRLKYDIIPAQVEKYGRILSNGPPETTN